MTYLMCDLRKRVLPVVTFTVISFLVSDRLVCARPQEGTYSPSQNYSNNSRETLAERIEPVIGTASNDRYRSTLNHAKRQIMTKVLADYKLGFFAILLGKELNEATNCFPLIGRDNSGINLKVIKNNEKITHYLNKIKTKIKDKKLLLLFEEQLVPKYELWISSKEVKSKKDLIAIHLRLLIFVLLLKLLTIFRSIKMRECQFLKMKNSNHYYNFINQNFSAAKCNLSGAETLDDVLFYTERIAEHAFDSLNALNITKCKALLNRWRSFVDFNEKTRFKRSIKMSRRTDLQYTIRSQVAVDDDISYADNSYREKLISNFLESSLPDLRSEYGSNFVSAPMGDSQFVAAAAAATESEEPGSSLKSPYPIVNDLNAYVQPRPTIHVSSTLKISTPPPPPLGWNTQQVTHMYPVQLITNKPKPNKPPPTTTIVSSIHSQFVTESNVHITSSSYVSATNNWAPAYGSQNWNNHHLYPNPTPDDKDPQLQFPDSGAQPDPSGGNEPFFVEPIVVSSVDQLPTNYPIPMENASLGHSPITVFVGSRPPEIVLLEDVPAPAPAEVADSVPAAADPAASSSGSIGPAVAGAAAAAAVAGAGALVTAGLGIVPAVVGGIATAAGAGIGAAAGGNGAAETRPDVAEDDPTAALGEAGAPGLAALAGAAMEMEAADPEEWYTELAESFMMIFSLRFLKHAAMALWSLVLPHVSFMLTSGFTVIAFLFPWLYPHIIMPLVSVMSGLTARFFAESW